MLEFHCYNLGHLRWMCGNCFKLSEATRQVVICRIANKQITQGQTQITSFTRGEPAFSLATEDNKCYCTVFYLPLFFYTHCIKCYPTFSQQWGE